MRVASSPSQKALHFQKRRIICFVFHAKGFALLYPLSSYRCPDQKERDHPIQSIPRTMLLSLFFQSFDERMFTDYGAGLGDTVTEVAVSRRAKSFLRHRSPP